ncbi:hypothetical protein [Mesorhizobium sp. GR13]|uniref:MerR family transcriptional regulator n=1 Tax=Mesorhizobium sp. GR13 TaxID=2562308 RepID=UPI0010C0AD68|nr:hypothetical protein [Mesorhizobium sp. GR13]
MGTGIENNQSTGWAGNMDDLIGEAGSMLRLAGRSDDGELTVRLVRDYIQRGILGPTTRVGREIQFTREQLIRLVAARILLADGWPLSKIAEHFDITGIAEIEALIPKRSNPALAALQQLRNETPSEAAQASFAAVRARSFLEAPMPSFSGRMAKASSIQSDLRDALDRLGVGADGPVTEELTLIAVATWCQVLVQTDRLQRLTLEEAEEVGKAITASLLKLATRKGRR